MKAARYLLCLLPLVGCARERPVDPLGRHTVIWLYPIDVNRPMIERLVQRFEKENPDVHIDIRAVPGSQYQTKLKTLVAAGEPPDVFVCGDVFFAYLKPFLSNLTDLVRRDAKEIDLEDFYPAVRKAMTPGGHTYFMPQWFNVSLLYYNRRIFDAAKEPHPTKDWTWDDYAQAAKRLTKNGVWGSTVTTGWWGEWLTLVHGAGGNFFDAGITRTTLDSPEAIRGLTFYRDTIREGFAPPPGEGPTTGFASDKVAMDYGGHVGLWATYRQLPSLDWDIEALPKGPAGRRGGEISLTALGISKTSPEREAAWRFLKFMSSKESIRAHVDQGYFAIRRSVGHENRDKGKAPHNRAAVETALETAEPIPSSKDFVEIALNLVQPEIDRMLTENVPPEQAARNATNAANAFLKATNGGAR
ncbi:sugar ABC transporter substrate-binding protein [bacterium]|nr:MAG: sugar ABC transporter substrate-binding protein [bacterium]